MRLAPRFHWLRGPGRFRVLIVLGFLLGTLVLIRLYITYRYVSEDLAIDHLVREAGD